MYAIVVCFGNKVAKAGGAKWKSMTEAVSSIFFFFKDLSFV